MDRDERYDIYEIPINIFDGPSAFNIPARNWIEAAILALIPGLLLWNLIPTRDLSIRIILTGVVCLPLGIFALVGYNGESLTRFARTYMHFRRSRRIMEYQFESPEDGEAAPRDELDQRLEELEKQLKDITDKAEKKAIRAEIKTVNAARKERDKKEQAEAKAEAAQVRKRLEDQQKAETAHADEMAAQEIEHRIEAGEKISKKERRKIQQEFRERYVRSIPKAPDARFDAKKEVSTQEYIPIDRIEDRCIITSGGRYIRILFVAPVNFPMFAADQQNFIINQFGILLRSCPVNIQIKTMAKSADVQDFIDRVEQQISEETDENLIAMMKDYINTLRTNATKNGVTRQFMLIVEYDESMATRNTTDKQRKFELENAVKRIKQQLKRCGNIVYEFTEEQDEVDYIYKALFSILDRFNTFGMDFADKVQYAYDQAASDENRRLTASDFIAPLRIDMTSPKYVVIDGVYYGYMYIPSNGYRSQVGGSWLFRAINAGGGIDVDIFFNRGDRDKIRMASRRQLNLSSGLMQGQSTNTDTFDQLLRKRRSADIIKNGLSEGQDFFYVTTMITVIAMSEELLFTRMREVSQLFDDMDMRCVPANYHQEDAFLGALPLCSVPPDIFRLGHRNMLTDGAASTYPFVSYELMDENGILMGVNLSNGSLVMPDVFNTARYKAPHTFIVGSTGAGKTYNLLIQAMHTRMNGIQVIIIAPLKGKEFRRSCKAMGGQLIRIGPGSPNCINVMEIRQTSERAAMVQQYLDGEDSDEESILSDKISSLETLFEIMIPDISNEEEQLLNGHIIRTYAKYGITEDNRSLTDPENPKKYRPMPTLRDLYDEMESDKRLERIRNILSKYVSGSASNFSKPTNVSLDNKYTVLDLGAFEHNTKMLPVAIYIALDLVNDKVKEDRTVNKRIFIDEIWKLIGKGAPEMAAQAVLEMFKTYRGYGAGVVAATQELGDFFALDNGAYAQAILNACPLGMIMSTETTTLNQLAEILELRPSEKATVQNLETGEALLIGSGNSVAIRIISSQMEHRLITTESHETSRIMAEEMNKGFRQPEEDTPDEEDEETVDMEEEDQEEGGKDPSEEE